MYGRTPLLYKKGDNLRIDFILKASAAASYIQNAAGTGSSGSSINLAVAGISGTNDYLMFLGKIIEKIGDQVTG